jgi:hypothetical protein
MRNAWTAAMALCLLPLVCSGQSLGSAAQKEKDRRKKNQEAGVKARTVTDDDLAASRPADAPAPSSSSSSTTASPPAERSGTAAGVVPPSNDDAESGRRAAQEMEWRSRMVAARARLEKAKKTHDALSKMSLVPGEEYVDERGRAVVTSAEQLQRLTAQAKAEVDAAQRNIDDLEERARRENVPPGWLR